jgi:hypothetical protein
LLDLVVWLHGAIRPIFSFILDEMTNFSLKFPDANYLLLINTTAAVVIFTFKVLRYMHLFRYLHRKVEEEDRLIT